MSDGMAEALSKQTLDLVSRFEARADSFKGRRDLCKLLVQSNVPDAEKLARELIGEGEHIATGIDGSMDFDERLQMMLFYSNAAAYSCPFTVGEHLRFDLAAAHRESKMAASAAVPLWAEDLGAVFNGEPEIGIELEHSLEMIPTSFMALGELFTAVQASEKSRVVFLDRPLSGTFSSLSRDARNLLKRGEIRLTRWGDSHGVTPLDVYLAVTLGPPSVEVPVRGRFLPPAIIRKLLNGPMAVQRVARELGVGEADVKRAVKGMARTDARYGNELLADATESQIKLNEKVSGYWGRVSELALAYAHDVFATRRHPLSIGGDQYMTILDVNTVALFILGILCERAREKGVLVIGMAKDTTATDITRSVLPFAADSGLIDLSSPAPKLKNDRAFLAILSSENPDVKTPWRSESYDSAFSTIVKTSQGYVSARKAVSRERLFVRSFFQLRTLRSDPSVRSQVFFFDRMYSDRHDSSAVRSLEVSERGQRTEVRPYFEGDQRSGLSNLVLHILSLNDNPEVFEAFGHNQLLFLADKAVKAEVRMLSTSLRGVANLRLGEVSRRRKVFGLVTPYRQQRAEAEHSRGRR